MVLTCTGDLAASPAALAPADGFLYSGWIEAMIKPISQCMEKGLPIEGIMLDTKLQGVPQQRMAEIVIALYTGVLITGRLSNS